jgi:hypothetical protein
MTNNGDSQEIAKQKSIPKPSIAIRPVSRISWQSRDVSASTPPDTVADTVRTETRWS